MTVKWRFSVPYIKMQFDTNRYDCKVEVLSFIYQNAFQYNAGIKITHQKHSIDTENSSDYRNEFRYHFDTGDVFWYHFNIRSKIWYPIRNTLKSNEFSIHLNTFLYHKRGIEIVYIGCELPEFHSENVHIQLFYIFSDILGILIMFLGW